MDERHIVAAGNDEDGFSWQLTAQREQHGELPTCGAVERDGSVWMATEHPSPTALHVIVAHDLHALEQKIVEAELASCATPASPLDPLSPRPAASDPGMPL